MSTAVILAQRGSTAGGASHPVRRRVVFVQIYKKCVVFVVVILSVERRIANTGMLSVVFYSCDFVCFIVMPIEIFRDSYLNLS
jgi:hypothetical protein